MPATRRGVAVVLDVVYNHLGPEGNYASQFGDYFTDMYKTPWGAALNFEQAHSDEVRRYFIENALQWIADFHIDGLRLDAIHAIVDPSARPFVEELAAACQSKGEESESPRRRNRGEQSQRPEDRDSARAERMGARFPVER